MAREAELCFHEGVDVCHKSASSFSFYCWKGQRGKWEEEEFGLISTGFGLIFTEIVWQ